MLFTITRDQYQRYSETAGPCRQYLLDKFPRLCSITDTFNNYFGAENVDIYGEGFKEKSLLLTVLELYEEIGRSRYNSLEEFLDFEFSGNARDGLFTDLSIYVHWPEVTVSNERNQSVVITDLYAKIPIYSNGKLFDNFTLSRATYTYEQFSSGYMHSHIAGISNDPSIFMRPCLGSGPLNNTQNSLRNNINADLWDLFCVELDRYVHVESIAGIPYRYLSSIGVDSRLYQVSYEGYRNAVIWRIGDEHGLQVLFRNFFKYVLIRKKMKFSFCSGMFVSAYTKTEWILKLSQQFLKFFALLTNSGNTDVTQGILLQSNLLMEVKMHNGKLHTIGSSRNTGSYIGFQNQHVLYFKGEDIRTHVDDPATQRENTYFILNPILALAFLDHCLNYLNIYEHEKNRNVIKDQQEEDKVVSGSSPDSSTRSEVKNSFSDYPIGEKRICLSL